MLNEAVARKVLQTVDAGLVQGVGIAEPGKMCVEAAVCYALGEPHGDHPSCVGAAVRAYKININDAAWSSNAARTKGMRAVSIAQLGSDNIDQRAFADYVLVEGVKRILPLAIRAASDRLKKPELLDLIPRCEAATDRKSARKAASEANAVLRKTAYAAAAADAAADAAYAAAAYAAADAAYAAAAYAAADARDKVLSLAADIAVEALLAQGCEGTQWLWLIEETKSS